MPVPLDRTGVLAKINRAWDHIHALDRAMRDWVDRHPWDAVGTKIDAEGREHRFRLEIHRQPDHLAWGLLIGDAVHNLRSALDHLVRAAAVREVGEDAVRPRERDLQFPICDTADSWNRALESGRLFGVSDPVVDEIRAVQPYNAGDGAEETVFAVLRDLSNADKHRILHTVATWVAPDAIPETTPPPPQDSTLAMKEGPFRDGDEFMTISFPEPIPNVQMYFKLAIQVCVEGFAVREDVRNLLSKIATRTQVLVSDVARRVGEQEAAPPN